MREISQKFLDNYATVNGGDTLEDTETGYIGNVFNTDDAIGLAIMLHVKGTTPEADGDIIFTFQFYKYVVDETPAWEWVDTPYTTSMNGKNDVCMYFVIPTEVKQIRLKSITNGGEAGNDALCNASLMKVCFDNLIYADMLIAPLNTLLNS